jgi:hypothetical protein
MTERTPVEFFSTICARTADGKISIALFDGPDEAVGLLSCSEETALNLSSNIDALLRRGDVTQ